MENKFKRMKFIMTLIKLTMFVEAQKYIHVTKKTQFCLFELIKTIWASSKESG